MKRNSFDPIQRCDRCKIKEISITSARSASLTNSFIPIVTLDTTYNPDGFLYDHSEERLPLSPCIERRDHPLIVVRLQREGQVGLRFTVNEGNSAARKQQSRWYSWHQTLSARGSIRAIGCGVDIVGDTVFNVGYGDEISLLIRSEGIQENAYIEFLANDEDYARGISNIRCGRVMIKGKGSESIWEIDQDGHIAQIVESGHKQEVYRLYAVKVIDPNEDPTRPRPRPLDRSRERTSFSRERTGAFLEVRDADILYQLQNQHGITVNNRPNQVRVAITSSQEVGNIFAFVATHSEVEWGMTAINTQEGRRFLLATSHHRDAIPLTPIANRFVAGFEERQMIFLIHSHPGRNGTRGATEIVRGHPRSDMHIITDKAHRFNNAGIFTHAEFPYHFVFHPYSQILYQYTPDESSLRVGRVNNNLLNLIRNTPFSSLHSNRR